MRVPSLGHSLGLAFPLGVGGRAQRGLFAFEDAFLRIVFFGLGLDRCVFVLTRPRWRTGMLTAEVFVFSTLSVFLDALGCVFLDASGVAVLRPIFVVPSVPRPKWPALLVVAEPWYHLLRLFPNKSMETGLWYGDTHLRVYILPFFTRDMRPTVVIVDHRPNFLDGILE